MHTLKPTREVGATRDLFPAGRQQYLGKTAARSLTHTVGTNTSTRPASYKDRT